MKNTIVYIILIIIFCMSCKKNDCNEQSDLTINVSAFNTTTINSGTSLGIEINITDLAGDCSKIIDTLTICTECYFRQDNSFDWKLVNFSNSNLGNQSILYNPIINFSKNKTFTQNYVFHTPGYYKLLYTVDCVNKIAERDKSNNKAFTPIGQIK